MSIVRPQELNAKHLCVKLDHRQHYVFMSVWHVVFIKYCEVLSLEL